MNLDTIKISLLGPGGGIGQAPDHSTDFLLCHRSRTHAERRLEDSGRSHAGSTDTS